MAILRIPTLLIMGLSCCAAPAMGQDIVNLEDGAVGAYLTLKQLRTTGSVLHVVAHPDDEDGALLAYCARGLGARTMLFAITRGEGGANLISSQFFDELGALRTLEHLKAAGYYGNGLFYSRAADYGFSKTLDEAMKQWRNGIPVLEDLVEVIRRERPTVILSRFRGDPRDGHGHHQMAGVLSRLAFTAAADPTQFPAQLERGLSTWQTSKLYVNARSLWRSDDEDAWTVAIPTGQYDPLLGKSYAQVARFGLGFQRSQGISGHDGEPGPRTSYYRLLQQAGVQEPADREESIFDGLDTTLAGLVPPSENSSAQSLRRQLTSLQEAIESIWTDWEPREPERTARRLCEQLKVLRSLTSALDRQTRDSAPELAPQLQRKEEAMQRALASCLGLQLDCWVTGENDQPINYAVASFPLRTHVRLWNANPHTPVTVSGVREQVHNVSLDESPPRELEPGGVFEMESRALSSLVEAADPTRPYWRRASIAAPMYEVDDDSRQQPTPPAPFVIEATADVYGVAVRVHAVVTVRQRHPVFGQVEYPLTIAPAMSVRFPLSNGLIPRGRTGYDVTVVVLSAAPGTAEASVALTLPPGWTSLPESHAIAFQREGEEATVVFRLQIPPDAPAREFTVAASADYHGQAFNEGYETITARDLGRLNIYRPAAHRVRIADVQLAGAPRVAYIPGSGDEVAESLATLGVEPRILASADLAVGDLSEYDVILVGVRAYAVREDVRKYNARLLEYVQRGGVLIVQYQTPEFDQNFGPYPYSMGRRPEEVSEEDAAVNVLQPNHPLFTTPNAITSADFDGWFEQRGSKFWTTWDPRYTPLLECHDAGQAPQEGGMLVARYGLGVYVYSAYAWYRQLPQGVPGAYRLFANMLSLPETIDP